jgi:hypothetical protein
MEWQYASRKDIKKKKSETVKGAIDRRMINYSSPKMGLRLRLRLCSDKVKREGRVRELVDVGY